VRLTTKKEKEKQINKQTNKKIKQQQQGGGQAYIFDIGHQLTPVKSRYPLTSIT